MSPAAVGSVREITDRRKSAMSPSRTGGAFEYNTHDTDQLKSCATRPKYSSSEGSNSTSEPLKRALAPRATAVRSVICFPLRREHEHEHEQAIFVIR